MISEIIIQNAIENKTNEFKSKIDKFSITRDFFNARLQVYISETSKWLESAVIGELGNNTFDHNFQFLPGFPRGVFFDSSFQDEYIIIADFGIGVLGSLRTVYPEIESDLEAVEKAFTQRISGRYPEQRGNGLKFVIENVQNNSWNFFFQSGSACCNADESGYKFSESNTPLSGTLAILQFL